MRHTSLLLILALATACKDPEPSGKGDDCAEPQVFYTDADGDGYGDIDSPVAACAVTSGTAEVAGDCDDLDATVHPDATESCNGVDDDCDDLVDDEPADGLQLYADLDGDGYGDLLNSTIACEAGDGWVTDSSDCDDGDDDINPDGADVCGEVDGDCDGSIDSCDFGAVRTSDEADATWTGQADHDYAGESLAYAGDVDGDGLGDVVVGAHSYDVTTYSNHGAAYVVYGGAAQDAALSSGAWYYGAAAGDRFGWAVAAAGDVDGDGYGEVLVTAPRADVNGAEDMGRVYLFAGDPARASGAASASDALATFVGAAAYDGVGTAVAPAGDVDGNGYADFLVGAGNLDATGDGDGAVWLVMGSVAGYAGEQALADHPRWTGLADQDNLGARGGLGSGDFNGDGLSDIVMGAPGWDSTNGNDRAGAAWVVLGTSQGFSRTNSLGDADNAIYGVLGDDQTTFGAAVAGVGDTDGDGYEDLAVGGPWYDTSFSAAEAGAVWLFRGGPDGWDTMEATAADIVVEGDGDWDWFGQSVAPAGDFDGDGLADVAVGAFGRDTHDADGDDVSNGGSAYVMLGGAAAGTYAAADLEVRIDGVVADERVGAAVAGGGDVDGDGAPDLIVGAVGAADGAGAALLFRGALD